MNELIAKIRAVLDEDERVARAALESHIVTNPDSENFGKVSWPLPTAAARYRNGGYTRDMSAGIDLIERFDPARVLRQVAAVRKIVELHHATDTGECYGCGATYQEEPMVPDANDCPVVLALAEAYGIEP